MLFLIWLMSALTLLIVSRLLPGFQVSSFYTALIVALLLGLVNAIIRPILLLLTLPINILTLGLFTFIINALMLWLVATIVKGFSIDNFTTAVIASLLMWAIGFATNAFAHTFHR